MEKTPFKYFFYFLFFIFYLPISSTSYKFLKILSSSFPKRCNIKNKKKEEKEEKEKNKKKHFLYYEQFRNFSCKLVSPQREEKVYTKNDQEGRMRRKKLYILITSPEGARIYRFLVVLLIYNLTKNKNDKNVQILCNNGKNSIIDEILNVPIISIGESCNEILNNYLNKTGFFNNIYKHYPSLVKQNVCNISYDTFNQINNSVKKLNIVFTPSKANSATLKMEMMSKYFKNQKECINANIVWVSSAISQSNFEDISTAISGEAKDDHIIKLTKINCYDTKQIVHSNKMKIKIKKKNCIVSLMSNSTVQSFYNNFGSDYNYVVCMGHNCYNLLKELNFKNIYFPHDSKLHTFLNVLIKLYNELKIKDKKKKYEVLLTREKHKNDQVRKILSEKNIPFVIIPCISTQYDSQGIQRLYSLISTYVTSGV
ncbi:conserved Plasmodium protein, unknown function [Plasmodium malariae]|uniref:Uroporphyrinogen-III synthase n=1 Tax=Plasmodium malariae TaxID=5858 RepID=A0A1D3TFK0_PLAMA|nr:conserved Plasmodium protein, unknown function [Plasmodium malariae]SCP03747.1 conserved Plasmodium protein, unknown function [Plasmodium malariae]